MAERQLAGELAGAKRQVVSLGHQLEQTNSALGQAWAQHDVLRAARDTASQRLSQTAAWCAMFSCMSLTCLIMLV